MTSTDRSPADDLRALWTGVRTTNAEGVCLTCHRGWGEHRDSCEVGRLDAALSQPKPPEPSGGEPRRDRLAEAMRDLETFASTEADNGRLPRHVANAIINKAETVALALERATPSPSPAELDVETVHRITCKGLIEHEPGSNEPYRWPCWDFAAAYAALRRTP